MIVSFDIKFINQARPESIGMVRLSEPKSDMFLVEPGKIDIIRRF